jgi:hypothetical protein
MSRRKAYGIPESGVKTTSSGLERLQPVDLAEYVVDQVS